ncbi:nuclear factor erythroid 2-related factor 1-like [Elysia marginata]|uniref:Nuclear factor erythroid 2-related factor 1-like n=1 Tax=Elysia marginata TaxID=1093978 RepID=A0AAV4GIA7_9GAST|nr:nuclear factor erythroid 2-related factor 1-like [Elysia marginata]
MIKEYFTDGLIGLAILLSLFRADLDLVNINNLINYPEVQDIIQGQTAAYLPANFHHLSNGPHAFGNPKHIDFDNRAFSAWFNNHINNFQFHGSRQNNIEAFLVSGPDPSLVSVHIQETSPSTNSNSTSNTSLTSPTLPEEGANSFPELSISNVSVAGASSSNENGSESNQNSTPTSQETTVVDVSFLFNNPFPGCNLTKEDLELIDILWKQDEDLGVGKEVYDANLRLELEKKQEMERVRLQEMKKAQLLEKERLEREKQEQASRWLKENFRRDGETGEWVRQNASLDAGSFNSAPQQPDNTNEEFPTLASALDYLMNMDADTLAKVSESSQQQQLNETTESTSYQPAFVPQTNITLDLEQFQQLDHQQQTFVQPLQPQPVPVNRQDSLEDSWEGLANYLNLTVDSTQGNAEANLVADCVNNNTEACQDFFLLSDNMAAGNGSLDLPSTSSGAALSTMIEPLTPEVDMTGLSQQQASDFLIHNVSMPADPMNTSVDLVPLTNASEMSVAAGPTASNMSGEPSLTSDLNTSPVDFDLSDLGFFENLTGLEEPVDGDLDIAEIDDMFRTIQSAGASLLEPMMELGQNMDTLQRLGEELNQSMASVGSSPSYEDFDALEGLEGAIGGSDDFGFNTTTTSGDLGGSLKRARARQSRSRVHHLSESSSDSGFAYKNGLTSSNSSAGSSYAGSPAGSSHGSDHGHTNHLNHPGHGIRGGVISSHNGSTSGNGTEHDPHGSHSLAQQQVAHNHTYNTPPGQVPREVKKYAHKEPSRKGPQSRDHRRALELKVPFTIDEIIESPVETFNEMLNSHKLTEAQLSLIRDIRRRGKNKVAAQNCRKRKVNVIVNLSDERSDLEKTRDRLLAERAEMEQERQRMRAKFGHLYAHIFQSLRDEHGQPYDPSLYSLQQSTDGNVFLVPRNMTTPGASAGDGTVRAISAGGGRSTGPSSAASSASSSPSTTSSTSKSGAKKRKTFDE